MNALRKYLGNKWVDICKHCTYVFPLAYFKNGKFSLRPYLWIHSKNQELGAGEMTQQLRASTAIANSVPRTHIGWFITVCTSSFRIQLLIYKGHYTRVHVDTHTRMHVHTCTHRMGVWKRENLSSDTRTHVRSWVLPWMPINPPLQKRDTEASLGLMDHHPGSRFSERSCLKGTRWRQSSLATQVFPCTDMDMHRRHTHTHKELWCSLSTDTSGYECKQ